MEHRRVESVWILLRYQMTFTHGRSLALLDITQTQHLFSTSCLRPLVPQLLETKQGRRESQNTAVSVCQHDLIFSCTCLFGNIIVTFNTLSRKTSDIIVSTKNMLQLSVGTSSGRSQASQQFNCFFRYGFPGLCIGEVRALQMRCL